MLCTYRAQMQPLLKSCARHISFAKARCHAFNSFPLLRDHRRAASSHTESPIAAIASRSVEKSKELPEISPAKNGQTSSSRRNATGLVPQIPKPGSLHHPRRSDVPARLLPKAQISPDLRLSPKERLQIEYETRRPPKPAAKPVFKERLLIYHGGLGYTNYIALLRVTTMFAAAFGLVIMAPAYYFYENVPWWTVPLIIVATTGPFWLVKFLARPFVSWIYLTLPQYARQSPRTALEYSRNLPKDAMLQICFMRATALTGQVEASIAELVPRKGKWPPTTFEWIGRRVTRGSWIRQNPTRFFVNQRSGTGKAARDTVPGIWENVYARIMGMQRGMEKSSLK